jgi:BASS family bile acid:Na+ symporter
LIFNPNLFGGLGGRAFIAAWWGIWHIVAGMVIAGIWSKKSIKKTNKQLSWLGET